MWGAAPAAAHVELERAEPAADAVLDEPPAEVFLRFTGEIEEGTVTIRVRGPGGGDVTAGKPQSGGRAAAVDLAPLTEGGVYRVRYEGVSADGHALEGRLRFRLSLAATPSPTATAAPSAPPAPTGAASPAVTHRGAGSVPWWPFALLLGIAALVGIMLFRRR